MTEASDFLRLILLTRTFFETADQQHEREHLDFVALLGTLHEKLCDARQCSSSPPPAGVAPKVHAHHEKQREEQVTEQTVTEKHPGRSGTVLRQTDGERLN